MAKKLLMMNLPSNNITIVRPHSYSTSGNWTNPQNIYNGNKKDFSTTVAGGDKIILLINIPQLKGGEIATQKAIGKSNGKSDSNYFNYYNGTNGLYDYMGRSILTNEEKEFSYDITQFIENDPGVSTIYIVSSSISAWQDATNLLYELWVEISKE